MFKSLLSIILFCSFLSPLIVLAQDSTDTVEEQINSSSESTERTPNLERGQSGAPTLSEAFDASQIRLSVIQGIVEAVTNGKRARVTLEYDLLTGADFREQMLREQAQFIGLDPKVEEDNYSCGSQPIKFTIPNKYMGKPDKWGFGKNEKIKPCLEAVLGIDDLGELSSSMSEANDSSDSSNSTVDFDSAFENFWLKQPMGNSNTEAACQGEGYKNRSGCGRLFLNNLAGSDPNEPRIGIEQFISMLRDRRILRDLLRSNGIAYALDISDEADIISPNRRTLPLISYEDIEWEFTIHETVLQSALKSKQGEITHGPVAIYRVGAKAKLGTEPITILFRGDTDPTISIIAEFRSSAVTDGSGPGLTNLVTQIAGTPLAEDLSPEVQALLQSIQENQSASKLDVVFSSLSGIPFNSLITEGLIGGTDTTSIVSGGLIGSGEVQALVGANLEFTKGQEFAPGVLLGVGPGGDESTLYLGPSLRASIFTLSTGARIFDEDGDTKIEPGGVISVDLSRATGNKKPQKIELPNSSAGGGWDAVESALASDLSNETAIVAVAVTGDSATENVKLTLWRKTDQEGKPIPGGQPRANFFFSQTNTEPNKSIQDKIVLLPRGEYAWQIENLPDGYEVRLFGEECPDGCINSETIPILSPPSPPQPSTDAATIAEAITSVAQAVDETSKQKAPPNQVSPHQGKSSFDFKRGIYYPVLLEIVKKFES